MMRIDVHNVACWWYLSISCLLWKKVHTSSFEDLVATSHRREKRRFHYQQQRSNAIDTPPPDPGVTIYDEFLYEQLDLSVMGIVPCENLRPDCDRYAAAGGCTMDPVWMLPHCPVSCNACGATSTTHSSSFTYRPIPQSVPVEEAFGLHEHRTVYPVENAIRLEGVPTPQRLVAGHEATIRAHIQQIDFYLEEVVDEDPIYTPVRTLCRTAVQHTDCAFWASSEHDLCTMSPNYMKKHGCTLFCRNCEILHVESVCPIDINEKNTWYAPNDLNEMFLSILKQDVYNVTVLSRPSLTPTANEDDDEEEEDTSLGEDAPWVLQLDDFLSADEANTLIQLGAAIGYSRSTETGAQDASGQLARQVSRHRTSTNAWCDVEACYDHPVVQALFERVYHLTRVPSDKSESLQLLRYEVGQFYKVHHDYIDMEVRRQQGVRIFTFFFYLNTLDENGGGGTHFPRLNLTVHPKLGRAVLWPNVLNHAPNVKDDRTFHQALVVEEGVKYGANAWYHQRAVRCDEEE